MVSFLRCIGVLSHATGVLGAIGLLAAGCSDYDVTREQSKDSWTQTDRGHPFDVLWVLDNSASMSEEQEALAGAASAFIDTLTANESEFRLAVTTTDRVDGELLGAVLDQNSSGTTAAFVAAITEAGISGDRVETGFAAALAAGSPELSPEFARSAADLELVIYSDEDDQSGIEAQAFLDELQLARPGFAIRVNTIVGDAPDGCASAAGAADPGLLYLEARELSGGARESICSNDTEALLTRMAHHVLGLETTFPLQALPLLASLTVTVDTVEIPRRDTDGWRYDGKENAVIFDGWAIPQPGAVIVMSYFNYTGGPLPDTGDTAR